MQDQAEEKAPMRVLHILNELKPSGAECMLRVAAPYWHRQGLQSDILSTGSIPGMYASVLEKSGYRIYHIQFSPSVVFLWKLFKLFKQHNYDVIHIHTERANFWYAMLGYLSRSRSIIRTYHNIRTHAFMSKKALRAERWLQRWLMRSVFGVKMVAISQSVKQNEWENFTNPLRLIPNWFDSPTIKPPSAEERCVARQALALPDHVMVFTSVGVCSPQKNHTAIIEALAGLPPDAPVVYLHVGPEAEGHPERKLAETVGSSSRIRFMGAVLDIIPILHASDIYLMPSLFEGLGIAALEAMAAGLPAIFADVPGLRDFREAGADIYWVEPTSPSILKAMLHFLDLPASDLRTAGLRLSRYVHTHFALERGAEAYAQLYRGELAKPTA